MQMRNMGINSHWGMQNTGSIGSSRPAEDNDNENGAVAEENNYTRGIGNVEDYYFKKQMEFKGGKLHQLITD